MRILFVADGLNCYEPLGVLYICALLGRHGHTVKVSSLNANDLRRLASEFQPQLIGFSVYTGSQRKYLRVNRWLKARYTYLSIFGGPHPTFFPDIIEEKGVDVVCRGEGERTVLELCDTLDRGEDISGIRNLWVKNGNGVVKNEVRPMERDLDALPFPDREKRYEYDEGNRTQPVKSFLTSRGCPFRCAYCFNPGMCKIYGDAWLRPRVRSPENVIREIAEVRSASHLRFVHFCCSIFPWRKDWLETFAGLYKREIGLPFYCHVKAELLDGDSVRLLADAGCKSVNMGIECGDERYRREVLNRSATNGQIKAACRRLHENGIAIAADNILGLPGGGLKMDYETLRLNVECAIEYPIATLMQPYPGTGLHRYAVDRGLFDGDLGRIDDTFSNRSPLVFRNKTEKRRIENFQKLFAVAAEIPWAMPLVRLIISLPRNRIFVTLFKVWYTYCYRSRIMPFRTSRKGAAKFMLSFFQFRERESFDER